MRDTARAIGAAAEKGDLSENSEYKFALEERDLLRARLAGMNAEMAIAKVIAPDDVPTDRIGVGTRAVFRRVEDGERYEMTFVGPWDTGAAGTLNYKAPLAQTLMGKRIGEQFDFEHGDASGRYELVELHNALREETPTL
jgi:transcription elongation factor GreA